MLGDSSFSGQCSCSLLEMTGVVLPPAWQRRVLDHGCWEIHSLCFLPQPRFLSDLLHGPMLAGAVCGGSAACSWLPGAQAGLGKKRCWGTSAVWVTDFAMSPSAGPADIKCPWDVHYEHSSLRLYRLAGDIAVPQLPLSAGAPRGTQHPEEMLDPSLNQAPLAYFQAFTDAIFSTLIFNPPSLSKPIFPNLKFPDAF